MELLGSEVKSVGQVRELKLIRRERGVVAEFPPHNIAGDNLQIKNLHLGHSKPGIIPLAYWDDS